MNKFHKKRKMKKNKRHKILSRMKMKIKRQTKNKHISTRTTRTAKKAKKIKTRPHRLLGKSKTRKNIAKVFYSSSSYMVVSSSQS